MFKRLFLNLAAALALALPFGAFSADPFVPLDTANIAVTGTAQTLTLPAASQSFRQAVVTNVGTQTVFWRADNTTATASNGMPLLANSQVIITLNGSVTTVSVIAAAVGSTLYVTVGGGQ